MVSIQSGLWKGESDNQKRVKVLRNTNFKMNNGHLSYDDVAEIDVDVSQLNSRILRYGDIILEKSGGSPSQPVGRVALFDRTVDDVFSFSNFCARVRVTDERIDSTYLWICLCNYYNNGGTETLQNGIRLLNLNMNNYKRILIPVPPTKVQSQIVEEFEMIETDINEANNRIIELKKSLNTLIDEIELSSKLSLKLRRIAHVNPPKPDKNDYSSDMMISFIEMAAVSEDGFVKDMETKSFSSVLKGGYTSFVDNDIIIAKITPCMENGKCALVTNLMNGVGYGSTEFHVIRADQEQVLPKYLFSLLNREKIRLAAKQRMTGKSGHRRVPESFYADLDIPLPHIDEQKAYVQEIETIEKQINDLNDQIRANNLIKKEILKKYL